MKPRLFSMIIPAALLTAYSALLIKVMVFKDLPTIRIGHMMFRFGGTQTGEANLVPFRTIWPYLIGQRGVLNAGINLIGNVALLVPIGFIAPFVFRNMTWKSSVVLAIMSGLAIEGMQAMLRVGIFDVDDVILNGLGVLIGYFAYAIYLKFFLKNK